MRLGEVDNHHMALDFWQKHWAGLSAVGINETLGDPSTIEAPRTCDLILRSAQRTS